MAVHHSLKRKVLFALLVLFVAALIYQEFGLQPRIARTRLAILNLVEQVELHREETGAIPESESALEEFMGSEMPFSAWGDQINYDRIENQFEIFVITEGWAGMVYVYSSDGDGTVKRMPF